METMSDGSRRSRRGLITGSLAGAGLAAGGAIFGQSAPALADTPGITVIQPSNDKTGATDSASIGNALKSINAQVILAPGEFYLDTAIVMRVNQRLIGSGANATKIFQTGSDHGITCKGSINYVTIAGLTLTGTGTGNTSGIYLAPDPATTDPSTFTNLTNITIEDCVVSQWGDCGVCLVAPIASRVTRVQSLKNGGDGFYVTKAVLNSDRANVKAATSVVFDACYALGNGKNGYELDTVSYSSLTGCASDGGTRGYALFGCNAVTLTSCGAEAFTNEGFLVLNGTSCALYGAYTWSGKTIGIHLTGSTVNQTIGGAVQSGPGAGTTNFIKTEAGTSCVVWGVSRPGTTDGSTDTFAGRVVNLDGSA